ncbi:MAG: peptide ABC transporter substrate-binding protein [Clostridia bacterium]|nr:peptide ABC transporter substrate-binding protein [Clostridia bacterium]MBR4979191.1 peptide ABC transporter substrate-binding protein [Clostridia bacterium]
MRKIISVLTAAALLICVFSGCSLKKSDGETFIMPVSDTPESLDPQIATGEVEKLIIANCYEGLVRIASDGSIENGVASSYSVSSDGLKYTFKLRDNTKWHSLSGYDKVLGEDFEKTFDFSVKARDFVFALRRALNPQTGCKEASRLFAIKNARKINKGAVSPDLLGVTAVDDYTLEISLDYKDDDFLYNLTSAAAMPCNEAFWTATAGKYGLSVTYTLCNGPFYLAEWNDDQNVRMTRNSDYSGENEVKPYSVRLIVNNDFEDIKEKTLSGTYDVGFFTENELFGEDKSLITSSPFENTVCSLIFNCSDECFKLPELRKAVCMSSQVDTSTLPVNVSSLASGLVPPFCAYNGESYRVLAGKAKLTSFSEKNAAKNFEKGLKKLGADTVRFNVLCAAEYEETVRTLIQSWQKTLGIKLVASVDVRENEELLSLVKSGDFSVAFCPLEASEQEAENFLNSFSSKSGDNILNFSDKKYDKLISEAAESQSVTELLACENYLLEKAVVYPVFNQNSYFVTAADTRGIYFYSNSHNVFFINAEREK